MLYLETAKNKGKSIGKAALQIPLWIGRAVDHSIHDNHEWMNYVQYLIIMAAIGYEASRIHARLDDLENSSVHVVIEPKDFIKVE